MSPLEPNGLYDQLKKAYDECLQQGWLEAAHFLKDEIGRIRAEFLKQRINSTKVKARSR